MQETTSPERKGFTGYTLKLIAIVTMFIDHIGAVVIENGILRNPNIDLTTTIMGITQVRFWGYIDFALRTVGRLSFPIFCFLLVQGFVHTRNLKHYSMRLLIFALVSEVPFDLALYGEWYHPEYQNVLFTLLLGLWVLSAYKKAYGDPLKQALAIIAGCGAAVFLRCDYNIIGIALILIFYIYRDNHKIQSLLAGFLAALESAYCLGAGALSLFAIRNYNGERGKNSLSKLFYWFYPVHLLLLYILSLLILK